MVAAMPPIVVICFVVGALINPSACHPIDNVENLTPTMKDNPLEENGSLCSEASSIVKTLQMKRLLRNRPSDPHYEFRLLEEPPPPGVPGLFETWFAPPPQDSSN